MLVVVLVLEDAQRSDRAVGPADDERVTMSALQFSVNQRSKAA